MLRNLEIGRSLKVLELWKVLNGTSRQLMHHGKNGTSEFLIRLVKRSLKAAIGESILTFSELQTVLFEVANLINERPIGRHLRSPEDDSYLCPNYLLLGRSTTRVPSGPFKESTNLRLRFEFIQNIVNSFWKK